MNMKRYIIMILGIVVPLLVMAQGAGGEIRRPVRTDTKSNSQQNRPANNTPPRTDNSSNQMSASRRNAVLKNIVDNMVYVEGGTFMMGATPEQGENTLEIEKPAHQITLSSFSIAKYEVTQEEWESVMGNNPSYYKSIYHPVENITWNDCQAFIRKLNDLTNRNFRLPTEAEWEFAARGGNRSNGYKYAGANTLDYVAWNDGNSNGTTHNVGLKSPNELGLYDMTGNVREWCQDGYEQNYYQLSPKNNPQGPPSGSFRMVRGASWIDAATCRISFRSYYSPDFSSAAIGFRLVMTDKNNNIHANSSSLITTQVGDSDVDTSIKNYDNPSILLNKDKSLKLISVSINKSETVLTLSYKNDKEGGWMNIDRNAYLYVDGTKYTMTQAFGIAYSPSYTYFSFQGETKIFKLHFKAFPLNTTRFDFIENDDSDWKMYGISLRN